MPELMPAEEPLPETVLVLLPGLDGTGILFTPLIEELPEHIVPQVVALPNDELLDYPKLVSYVCSRLPAEKPFLILGESFSGPLSVMVAATRPERMKGLILCATFIRNPTYFPAWIRHLSNPWLFRLAPLAARSRSYVTSYSNRRLRELLVRTHQNVSARVLAHRVRLALAVDVSREFAACPVPVAYLRGTRDWVVPSRNLKQIRSVQDVTLFEFPAPHLLLQNQPRLCAQAIASFVDRVLSS